MQCLHLSRTIFYIETIRQKLKEAAEIMWPWLFIFPRCYAAGSFSFPDSPHSMYQHVRLYSFGCCVSETGRHRAMQPDLKHMVLFHPSPTMVASELWLKILNLQNTEHSMLMELKF